MRVFTGLDQQAAMFGNKADDTVFINSRVTRIDDNFLLTFANNPPSSVKLNHGKIYVSSVPQEEADLQEIKELGITSVLDLTGIAD